MFDIEKVHKRLAETHIQHPQIASIENALIAHVKSGFRADGAMIFVLKGESGSGKSRVVARVIEHVYREAGEEFIDEGETLVSPLPASQVKVPSDSTLKALAAKTQAMLGARPRRVQTQEEINLNIREWIRRRKVRLIIFDEVQQLIEREGKRPIVIQNAANWLKVFLDESNVPMILVGTDDLEPILDHDKRQLRNRTVRTKTIGPSDFDDARGCEDFRGVLYTFEDAMKLPGKSNLASRDMAKRFHLATSGYIGRIYKLLHGAASVANENGDATLNRINLGLAYHEGASPEEQKFNPFTIEDVSSLPTSKFRMVSSYPATVQTGKKIKVSANDLVNF